MMRGSSSLRSTHDKGTGSGRGRRRNDENDWADIWGLTGTILPQCKICGKKLCPKTKEGDMLVCNTCLPEEEVEKRNRREKREMKQNLNWERKVRRWEQRHEGTISATWGSKTPTPKITKNSKKHQRQKKAREEKRAVSVTEGNSELGKMPLSAEPISKKARNQIEEADKVILTDTSVPKPLQELITPAVEPILTTADPIRSFDAAKVADSVDTSHSSPPTPLPSQQVQPQSPLPPSHPTLTSFPKPSLIEQFQLTNPQQELISAQTSHLDIYNTRAQPSSSQLELSPQAQISHIQSQLQVQYSNFSHSVTASSPAQISQLQVTYSPLQSSIPAQMSQLQSQILYSAQQVPCQFSATVPHTSHTIPQSAQEQQSSLLMQEPQLHPIQQIPPSTHFQHMYQSQEQPLQQMPRSQPHPLQQIPPSQEQPWYPTPYPVSQLQQCVQRPVPYSQQHLYLHNPETPQHSSTQRPHSLEQPSLHLPPSNRQTSLLVPTPYQLQPPLTSSLPSLSPSPAVPGPVFPSSQQPVCSHLDQYWRKCDVLSFEMGTMVADPPPEKCRDKIKHLLRLQVLAWPNHLDYARNMVMECTEKVHTAVKAAKSRVHACQILTLISRCGKALFDTWYAILIPHIKELSSRGNRRATDHRKRVQRANELFLLNYLRKLNNFLKKSSSRPHIDLQDVQTALMLYGDARTPYADHCIGTMIGAGNV